MDRAGPGLRQGDLILGLNSSAIGPLVERTSRFTSLLHLPPLVGHGTNLGQKNGPALAEHGAEEGRNAIARNIAELPSHLRRAPARDRGAEMAAPLLGMHGSDPLEDGVRGRLRDCIGTILEEELESVLGRSRHERKSVGPNGHRNRHRDREIVGTFGPQTVRVPRARIAGADGRWRERRSQALLRYRRPTRKAEAPIAGTRLAGTNTRRVKRALSTLFAGAVGKDVVTRAWRKVKTDWAAWNTGDLGGKDIVRLIPDGTVVRVGIDRKATANPILVAVGVRRDGQKVLIGPRNMGGETAAARRARLRDPSAHGLREPGVVIVAPEAHVPRDGAPGPEAALTGLRPDAPFQRRTVHKHRNLLAHAPKRLHEEPTEDCRDMIHAETAQEIERRRKAVLREWQLTCRAVADSLEEAGERLSTFSRLPPGQWKSARATSAVERLNAEFNRRIEIRTGLPRAETAPMLFRALLASGRIVTRKIDGRGNSRPAARQPAH